MTDSNQTFLNVVVVVLLGAFFATSATIGNTWKHETTAVDVSASTQQEAPAPTKTKLP